MYLRGVLLTLKLWLLSYGALALPSNQHDAKKTLDNSEICDTQECHQISDRFRISMNQSIEPCDDFYEFACGNWEVRNPFPRYGKKWNRLEEFNFLAKNRLREELESPLSSEDNFPIREVKKWYQSCMNESRKSLDSINAILLRTGGWPMVMGSHAWNKSAKTWQEIDRHHQQLIGDNTFYTTEVTTHLGFYDALQINNQTFPLHEVLPLNPRNFTSDDGVFYRFILKSIGQLFIEEYNSMVSDEDLEKDVDEIIKFEEKLYEASKKTSIEIESYERELSKIDVNGFIEWWKNRTESIATTPETEIDWLREFEGFFDIANLTLNTSMKIEIESIGFLMNLVEILKSTDERIIVNYIQWNFVSKIFTYTNDDMKDIFHEIIKRQEGIPERPPRWLECVDEIQIRDAASYLFVKKYYTNSTGEAIAEMVENIKKSVEFQITNLTWLSSDSKESIKEKMRYIKHAIGHPSWYTNESAFIDLYKGLRISENYLENNLNFLKYGKIVKLREFRREILPARWSIDGLKVNGVFEPTSLTMMVSGATVQPPLFVGKVPDYVNHGTVGSIIGHEISHGFDSSGIYFFGPFFLPMLRNNETKLYYLHLECFIEMYDKNYTSYNNVSHKSFDKSALSSERLKPINEYRHSGENVARLNEFIADAAGLKATLHAYRESVNGEKKRKQLKLPGFEKFTDDQMFFISFSQGMCGASKAPVGRRKSKIGPHADPQTRMITTLSNTLAFTEAFQCKKGSAMNRENKCDGWSE